MNNLNLFLQPKSEVALLPIEDKRLLTADKADLSYMASLIVSGVDDGNSDPLDTLIMAKKGEYVFKNIAEALKGKVPSPGKEYSKYYCDITERATGVQYSFDTCNDPIWVQMNIELIELKGKLKARENWLKTFTKPTQIEDQVDEESGEVIMEARVINPPVKMAGSSIVVSIKNNGSN